MSFVMETPPSAGGPSTFSEIYGIVSSLMEAPPALPPKIGKDLAPKIIEKVEIIPMPKDFFK
jgi:hypothetical protein